LQARGAAINDPNSALQNLSKISGMVQQMKSIQTCIQQKDPEGYAQMNEAGQSVSQQVRSLCQSGDREKAQKISSSFVDNLKQSSAYQAMQVCAPRGYQELAASMMGGLQSNTEGNVCDMMAANQEMLQQ
jgi:predicted lipoprotein